MNEAYSDYRITSKIPYEWRTIFDRVFQIDSHAVVAGGAIRDLDHNIPIRDLDIFIRDKFSYEVTEKFNKKSAWTFSEVKKETDPKYKHIVKSLTVNINKTIVNLVFLDNKNPEVYWKHFDYGLCQIMFDGSSVWYSDNYIKDRDRKTLTICGQIDNREQFGRTLERYEKLKQKYRYPLCIDPYLDIPHEWKQGLDIKKVEW